MDNRIFNVNGKGADLLARTLQLAFAQNGNNTYCRAWSFSNGHGLILHWHEDSPRITSMPAPLNATEVLPFVTAWLAGEMSKTVTLSKWENDQQHDGHNSEGWRVYCEDWGHVDGHSSAICAIKRVFLWHGK